MSWLGMLPGDFWGSPTLLWLGHVLMSVSPVTIEIRAEYSSLGLHLRSCWSLRVKLPPELYKSGSPVLHPRVMVLSGPKLLQGLCLGTWVPLQSESVLKYIVYAATKGHTFARDLCWWLRAEPLLGPDRPDWQVLPLSILCAWSAAKAASGSMI